MWMLEALGLGRAGCGRFETDECCRERLNKSLSFSAVRGVISFGPTQLAEKVAAEEDKLLVSFFFDDACADSRDLLEVCLNSQELAELVLDSPLRPVSILAFNVANEAHCEYAQKFGIGSYPAIAFQTRFHSRFQTVASVEGFLDSGQLCSILRSIFLAIEFDIANERNLEHSRNLQEEQDAAYRRSLAIDREKRQTRQHASPELQNLVEEAVVKCTVSESSIEEARTRLPPEPAVSEPHYRFSFQLPCGTRLVRRFAVDCRIQNLFDFIVSSGKLEREQMLLKAIHPPMEFSLEDSALEVSTLGELSSGTKLFVDYRQPAANS